MWFCEFMNDFTWSKSHVTLLPHQIHSLLSLVARDFEKVDTTIFISPLTSRDYTIKDSYDFVGPGWLLNHYLQKFGGLGLVEVELQSFNSYSHWITNTKFSIYCMTSRDPMIKLSHDKSQLIIC